MLASRDTDSLNGVFVPSSPRRKKSSTGTCSAVGQELLRLRPVAARRAARRRHAHHGLTARRAAWGRVVLVVSRDQDGSCVRAHRRVGGASAVSGAMSSSPRTGTCPGPTRVLLDAQRSTTTSPTSTARMGRFYACVARSRSRRGACSSSANSSSVSSTAEAGLARVREEEVVDVRGKVLVEERHVNAARDLPQLGAAAGRAAGRSGHGRLGTG